MIDRKNLPRILTLCLISLVIAGCGGRRGKTTEEWEELVGKEGELLICWQRGSGALALQELVNDYPEEFAVKVIVARFPRDGYYEHVKAQFSRKYTQYDLFVGKSHWLSEFTKEGYYLDISDFLKRDVGLLDVHPLVRRSLCEYPKDSGYYFAVPCYPDMSGLIYRKDWFQNETYKSEFKSKYGYDLAAPSTWKQLRDAAEYFHDPVNKRYGVALQTGRFFNGLVGTFQQVLYGMGGQYYDEQASMMKGSINSATSVQAVDMIRELIGFGPEEAGEMSAADVVQQFANGDIAMAIANYSTFDVASSMLPGQVGFAMVPGSGDHVAAPYMEGYGMSVSAKRPEERIIMALEFMRWFMSDETQKRWREKSGVAFLREDIEGAAGAQQNPHFDVYKASLVHARGFWDTHVHRAIMGFIQKNVGDAVDGYIEPQKALDDLAEMCDDLLRKENILSKF